MSRLINTRRGVSKLLVEACGRARLNTPVLKTGILERVSWVRIPSCLEKRITK